MKVQILEREIIECRQQMKYGSLPQLIERYHRKYFPDGTILGYLCLAECAFKPPPVAYDSLELISQYDCVDTLNFIEKGLKLSKTGNDCVDLLILKAYCLLLAQEPSQSAVILDSISDTSPASTIQLYCIKAWASYILKKDEYKNDLERAFSLIKGSKSDRIPLLSYWIENSLYSYCVLNFSEEVAMYFLEQHTAIDSLKVIGVMFIFLSNLVAGLKTSQPLCKMQEFSYLKSNAIITADQDTILKNLRKWLPYYESLVLKVSSFPIGSRDSIIQNQRLERVETLFDWWVYLEMFPAKYADDGIGDIIDRHYRLLEILYRGTKHTFLSLKLLRYIANTFFSLSLLSRDSLCLDEKKEAGLIVASYVFHWEKKFTMMLDTKMKEIRDSKRDDSVVSRISFSSHRMSGQISQLPNMNARVYEKEIDSPQRENTNGEQKLLNIIAIRKVESETVEDVVGVLVTGIKLILKQHEGRVDLLNEAAKYGEKAFVIVTEHGANLANYEMLLSKVFQCLGLVYGELSLEVSNSEERMDYIEQAVVMLKKAVLHYEDSICLYQLALALSEAREVLYIDQIDEALLNVNRAIELNPYNPLFYNLLSLLMSSKARHEDASHFALVGLSTCIKYQGKEKTGHSETTHERQLLWDDIDPGFKEELLNLRLTYIASEMKLRTKEEMVIMIEQTFGIFKRLLGNVGELERRDEELNRRGSVGAERKRSLPNALGNIAIGKIGNSSVPGSVSLTFIPVIHRLRSYELPISLWLILSDVYRKLNWIEKANSAVKEAARFLHALCQTHNQVRHQASRVHRDFNHDRTNRERKEYEAFKANSGVIYSGGYWKDTDPAVSRIQADIAFQQALILYSEFEAKFTNNIISENSRYLSPVARAEAEMNIVARHQAYQSLDLTSGSVESLSLNGNTAVDSFSPPTIEWMETRMVLEPINSKKSLEIQHTNDSQNGNSKNVVTLSQVIHKVKHALLFDPQLLPARAFLGLLYKQKGNFAQAEYHLELACMENVHRGSSAGRTGFSSVFGGATSVWGWSAWSALGDIFKEQGRSKKSQDAIILALELYTQSSCRGFEVLSRF